MNERRTDSKVRVTALSVTAGAIALLALGYTIGVPAGSDTAWIGRAISGLAILIAIADMIRIGRAKRTGRDRR